MKRQYIISFSLIFGVIPLLVVAAIVAIRYERDHRLNPLDYIPPSVLEGTTGVPVEVNQLEFFMLQRLQARIRVIQVTAEGEVGYRAFLDYGDRRSYFVLDPLIHIHPRVWIAFLDMASPSVSKGYRRFIIGVVKETVSTITFSGDLSVTGNIADGYFVLEFNDTKIRKMEIDGVRLPIAPMLIPEQPRPMES